MALEVESVELVMNSIGEGARGLKGDSHIFGFNDETWI